MSARAEIHAPEWRWRVAKAWCDAMSGEETWRVIELVDRGNTWGFRYDGEGFFAPRFKAWADHYAEFWASLAWRKRMTPRVDGRSRLAGEIDEPAPFRLPAICPEPTPAVIAKFQAVVDLAASRPVLPCETCGGLPCLEGCPA